MYILCNIQVHVHANRCVCVYVYVCLKTLTRCLLSDATSSQGASNRNIFRNCGGTQAPGPGPGPGARVFLFLNICRSQNFGKCNFVLSVLVCMFHLLSPQRRPTTKKHTCKNAPASSQSGVIPVTHKGPFLCHSLADPGRMCDILKDSAAVPLPYSIEYLWNALF